MEKTNVTRTDVPGPEMINIPGGTFMMGVPPSEKGAKSLEGPVHKVTLNPFRMGKFTVTQKEFVSVMGFNPNGIYVPDYPMDYISWYDAIHYCNALSSLQGLKPVYAEKDKDVTWDRGANGYRLPTEAEWEYACRAGTTTPYYVNLKPEQISKLLFFYGNYDVGIVEKTVGLITVVGHYPPNPWNLYDMMGNVFEWCWDWWKDGYPSADQDNPVGPDSGTIFNGRVLRGGAWFLPEIYLRSGRRDNGAVDIRFKGNGIRLVRNAE
jgi:formylglycine-generating enzyme required for sulfatase activity